MKWLKRLTLLVVALAVLLLLAGQLGLLAGQAPTLGVHEGRLAPPSLTPNSVSSQTGLYPGHPQQQYAAIAPLAYQGDPAAAMQRLLAVLGNMKRTVVVVQGPDYVYAQCSTPWLHFTDDLEFWLDRQNQVIQMRSASRIGRGDWGVNRARVEAVRAAVSATGPG